MTDPNPTTDPKPEPTGDDLPPHFRDPAEAPNPTRPPEHLEPEEDDEDGA